jgi:predicted metalloprotease with PDZ domain
VELEAPADAACAGWQVATTLPRIAGTDWGFGRFRAVDYDELIDHPVEMGPLELHSFQAGGVPHHLAISGRHRGAIDRLVGDLAVICQWHCDFWGVVPMSSYLFQLNLVGDGYGGLEHRASTSLISRRDDLQPPGKAEQTDAYRGLLGLCSHEYFHTWNVKRLKPAAFWPYDLSRESHTTLLWAFEGITSYYDDLALLRAHDDAGQPRPGSPGAEPGRQQPGHLDQALPAR